MARTIGIGRQDFEKIRINKNFYIDKTNFIKEWWESQDDVTLIARPRRFGKTLNMSMLEKFFSNKYENRGDLFEGLSIWQEEKYRKLQGSYPVISLSFANVKATNYQDAKAVICQLIVNMYSEYEFLLESESLSATDKAYMRRVTVDMNEMDLVLSIHQLSKFLYQYYGRKTIILLDEYDTPMQEAYVSGYWEEIVAFIRSMFNSTFKTNPYLERAVMTGITRVSKESIFSDLNNLEVVTITSEKYADCFGFTEEEVFDALDEFGLSDKKQDVKMWYDGFTFGSRTDIYNPWSILNYLDKKMLDTYWANTSSNSLVGKLVREGEPEVKQVMKDLMQGEMFHTVIDEQIVFSQLEHKRSAVWSLLLASGYLKVEKYTITAGRGKKEYDLKLTNMEVRLMFEQMVEDWFSEYTYAYNEFVKALLLGDEDAMNVYMNRVTNETFSYFDTGKNPSESEPERFYHGFVLGLMVDLSDRYALTSNRESGFGRYDIMLEPKNQNDDAIIIEFKVQNPRREPELSETVEAALKQIEDKNYAAALIAKGIPEERIRSYGFAFCGKKVLIGTGGKNVRLL